MKGRLKGVIEEADKKKALKQVEALQGKLEEAETKLAEAASTVST